MRRKLLAELSKSVRISFCSLRQKWRPRTERKGCPTCGDRREPSDARSVRPYYEAGGHEKGGRGRPPFSTLVGSFSLYAPPQCRRVHWSVPQFCQLIVQQRDG